MLRSGGYLLVDEIENHFNKEIVTTLMRLKKYKCELDGALNEADD